MSSETLGTLAAEGRAAFDRGDGESSRRAFEAALVEREDAELLEGLARALYLLGDYRGSMGAHERAFAAFKAGGDAVGAARAARILAWLHLNVHGDWAVCNGWLARAGARRLRCSCRLPRTRGRTDTRPRMPCAARAGRGSDEIPGGRTRRRARSALVNGGRRARRARSRPGRIAARANRICLHARQRCAHDAAPGRPPAGAALSGTLVRVVSEALSAAMFAGRLAAPGASTLDVARAAKAAPRPPVLGGLELLLDGLATFFCDGYEAAVPILRRSEKESDGGTMPVSEQLRWKWLAAVSSVHLWGDARWEAISEQHVRIARETGALGELPLALSQRVYAHLFAGRADDGGVAPG